MLSLRDFVLDAWTALSHKEVLQKHTGQAVLVPSWMDRHNQRRLTAYKVLAAYQENASRFFLPAKTERHKRDERREYGDASLIVNVVLGALLGDDQSIVVDGADDEPPEGAPDGYLSPEQERQEWLIQWAADERLKLKMIESERNAIGLGDGVYMLAWSNAKQRPVMRVFDPGWYFPALSSGNEDDYPSRVHIAWEEHDLDGRILVHRITWELGPIRPQPGPDGLVLVDEVGGVVLHPGDVWREDGTIERILPYHEPGESTTLTCYMTEATWTIEALGDRHVDDLSYEKATFAVTDEGDVIRDMDLQIDFLPVVHIPNTVSLLNHFGRSVLATILQILDDLQLADTDVANASVLAAGPPIALSGTGNAQRGTLVRYNPDGSVSELGDGNGAQIGYEPLSLWRLPEGGRLDMLDTSQALDAILKYVEHLLKRLTINARVPDSVLGRVKASEVASGVQLAMMFGPLQQMVGEMRLVRDEKYPLILKFVQRLASVGGVLDGVPMDAAVAFGSYLPSDRHGIVTEVTTLMTAHAISTHTAAAMLVEAGFPIDDAQAEVERIEHENFEAAVQLLAALGDEKPVYEYLGMTPPTGPAPPPIDLNLPGGHGGSGGQ